MAEKKTTSKKTIAEASTSNRRIADNTIILSDPSHAPRRLASTNRLLRRGGRAVECTGLENRQAPQGVSGVRIPPPPLTWLPSAIQSDRGGKCPGLPSG